MSRALYIMGEIVKWILISPLLAFAIIAAVLGISLFIYFIVPLLLCVWFLWIWIPGFILIWFLTIKLPSLIG